MFESLRFRNYRIFFAGQLISFTGSWMQVTAQAWLVYRLTGDPFQLGLVGFLNQFPILVLGSWGGATADRSRRRKLIFITQSFALIQAIMMAWLALSGRVEVWHVYVLAFVIGAVNAFDFPARQVFIGELVPEEHRHNAIALNSSVVNGSRIIGPAAAGLIVGLWGEGVCFAVNAASFLAVLAAILSMRGVHQVRRPKSGSAFDDIRQGFKYILHHDALRLIFLVLIVLSMAGMPFIILMPVFAEEVLGRGASGFGVLMACSGAGATVGSLFLARRRSTAGLERLMVRMTVFFGLALAAFTASRDFALSCFLLSLVGVGMIMQLAGVNTLLQELAGEKYRGRMMGFYLMGLLGVAPFGSLLAGIAASRLGAPATVAIGGIACVLIGLVVLRRLPEAVERHRRKHLKGVTPPVLGGRPYLNA